MRRVNRLKKDAILDRQRQDTAQVEPRVADPQDKELSPIIIEGMTFDLSKSRTRPANLLDDNVPESIKLLVEFLELLNANNCLEMKSHTGTIVCADDQLVNRQHMERTLKEIGVK